MSGEAKRTRIGVVITCVVASISIVVVTLVHRAEGEVNQVALTEHAQPVTTVQAVAATFQPTHSYVGTLEPWNAANIGPQFVAAYVEDVSVRPGARVKRGDVLATLDCRDVNSSTAAVAARARAIEAQQLALANQVKRMTGLLDHGFVSADDVEQKTALSAAQSDQLAAERAHLSSMSLQVADCVLRAPFDAEVTQRALDPGAFARPGASIVAITDRRTVRFAADVPESDFRAVAEGNHVRIHVDAVGLDVDAVIARRTPSADYATRTIHFEADLANPDLSIPVRVTGVVTIPIGDPVPAATLPVRAAAVRNGKASVFAVVDGVAHARTVSVLGEREDMLYVESALAPGTRLVTEGRALLADGDHVAAQPELPAPNEQAKQP